VVFPYKSRPTQLRTLNQTRNIFSELKIFQVDEEGLRLDNFLNPSLVEDNVLPENHPLASLVLTDDFEVRNA